jgi:hypothetical protein
MCKCSLSLSFSLFQLISTQCVFFFLSFRNSSPYSLLLPSFLHSSLSSWLGFHSLISSLAYYYSILSDASTTCSLGWKERAIAFFSFSPWFQALCIIFFFFYLCLALWSSSNKSFYKVHWRIFVNFSFRFSWKTPRLTLGSWRNKWVFFIFREKIFLWEIKVGAYLKTTIGFGSCFSSICGKFREATTFQNVQQNGAA